MVGNGDGHVLENAKRDLKSSEGTMGNQQLVRRSIGQSRHTIPLVYIQLCTIDGVDTNAFPFLLPSEGKKLSYLSLL
jgi:pSer/pThr/pTyr-binding forkhead associated (FHA) protein